MPVDGTSHGWAWFAHDAAPVEPDPEELALCRAFARCFAGADGRVVLERRLPPSGSDAELRHLEGQRCVVAQIVAMVERGCA